MSQNSNKAKNPLLQSIGSSTFDDLSNFNAIILPAAEPQITHESKHQEEVKPKFIIGDLAGSDAFETENFSEISLDRDSTADLPSLASDNFNNNIVSPLADLDGITQETQEDINYNPLSAALAQLPNAASTVFTTFSNIIKGSSTNPQFNINRDNDNTDNFIEPYIAPETAFSNTVPVVPVTADIDEIQNPPVEIQPPPIPTFYSPDEINLLNRPHEAKEVVTNTFRLGGHKRKQYAHIPGLSADHSIPTVYQTNTPPVSSVPLASEPPVLPSVTPPLYFQPELEKNPTPTNQFVPQSTNYSESIAFNNPSQSFYEPAITTTTSTSFFDNNRSSTTENVKPNKFSFTSLIPTQILEKIPVPSFVSKEEKKPTPQSDYFSASTEVVTQNLPPPTPPNLFNPQLQNPSYDQQLESNLPSVNPPPTFYNPSDVNETFKKSTEKLSTKNPYSSNYLSRGAPHYKNPLISTINKGPIFVPPSATPTAPTNFFTPITAEASSFPANPIYQPSVTQPTVSTAPPTTSLFNSTTVETPKQPEDPFSQSFCPSQVDKSSTSATPPTVSAPLSVFNPTTVETPKQPEDPFSQSFCPPQVDKPSTSATPPTVSAPIPTTSLFNPTIPETPKQSENLFSQSFYSPPTDTSSVSARPPRVSAPPPATSFFNPTSEETTERQENLLNQNFYPPPVDNPSASATPPTVTAPLSVFNPTATETPKQTENLFSESFYPPPVENRSASATPPRVSASPATTAGISKLPENWFSQNFYPPPVDNRNRSASATPPTVTAPLSVFNPSTAETSKLPPVDNRPVTSTPPIPFAPPPTTNFFKSTGETIKQQENIFRKLPVGKRLASVTPPTVPTNFLNTFSGETSSFDQNIRRESVGKRSESATPTPSVVPSVPLSIFTPVTGETTEQSTNLFNQTKTESVDLFTPTTAEAPIQLFNPISAEASPLNQEFSNQRCESSTPTTSLKSDIEIKEEVVSNKPSVVKFYNPASYFKSEGTAPKLQESPVKPISAGKKDISLPPPPAAAINKQFDNPIDFFNCQPSQPSEPFSGPQEAKPSVFANYFSSPTVDFFNKSQIQERSSTSDITVNSRFDTSNISDKVESELSLFTTSEFPGDTFRLEQKNNTFVNTSLNISNYLQKAEEQPPEEPVNLRSFSENLLQDSVSSNCVAVESQTSEKRVKLTIEDVLRILESSTEDCSEIDVMAALDSLVDGSPILNKPYRPVYCHWFYETAPDTDKWTPMTMTDSLALDEAFTQNDPQHSIVPTDGGRFDVNIVERKRYPVYWNGKSSQVRRCSWFVQNDSTYIPYTEEIAEQLEKEFQEASLTNDWHRKIELESGEMVVFHEPNVIVHFYKSQVPDIFATASSSINRPRIVKRGVDVFNIEDGETNKIDHLIFMVHGIGSVCDLQFRTVEQVVDQFRSSASVLIQSHYKTSFENGSIGRIEILPISWYNALHSAETGIDQKLKSITLESIPKLRNFTNETLLDILFYSSPRYCQGIIDHVVNSINKVYSLFIQRNDNFTGDVSLCGHSLGSLILFDILYHQTPPTKEELENLETPDELLKTLPKLKPTYKSLERQESKQITYCMGSGTGSPFINYPHLIFQAKNFFALGSPIGMFVTIRGIDNLGLDFKLPTCDGFYNIFHPFDPVAYRMEALINPDLNGVRPVLIAHHKGRKRMHLELKETITKVSAEIKQKVMDVFKNTIDTVCSLTPFGKNYKEAIESEVDKVLESQLAMETGNKTEKSTQQNENAVVDNSAVNLPLGKINRSKRVDYMLQEAPLEFINEYIFALTSHVCYWDSPDTILFMIQEIYSQVGVQADSQIPQHSMTVERKMKTSSSNETCGSDENDINVNDFTSNDQNA